ncbi:MAG TPA: hypothetical protein VK960_02710 [Acidimicrobiia bacterium]|nr:hypothetical protein [Acidimicrobiia bacterium]
MSRLGLLLSATLLVVAACGDDATTTTATTGSLPGSTTSTQPTSTIGSTAPSTTTTSTTLPSTTTTASAPVTTHPGLPAAASRSLIPWDQVDQGWVVVRYEATTTSYSQTGPYVIYLVSPGGQLYEIRAFTDSDPIVGEVEAFSNDGRQVVLQLIDRVSLDRSVVSLSLESGLYTTVLNLGGTSHATLGTTLPTGRDVVVLREDASTSTDSLEIYRTNGDLFSAIASKPSGGFPFTWLYSLDGTHIVVNDGNSAGMVVYSNTGTQVRTLSIPSGSGLCEPVRWWSSQTILAACVDSSVLAANGFYHELWLVPYDGSPPMVFTASTPGGWASSDFGYANAWGQDPPILQWHGDCAAGALEALFQMDLSTTPVSVAVGGSPFVHARAGTGLVIHSVIGCGDYYGPVSLIGADGSLLTTLVPAITGYIGVTSVAAMIPTP